MTPVDLSDADLLRLAGRRHSQSVISINSGIDAVLDILSHGNNVWGESLPWSKTHDDFAFRPNELTVWAGENASGKTLMLSHVMAESIHKHEQGWFVMSLEMPLPQLQARFVRQTCGTATPEEVHARKALYLAGKHCYVYDSTERKNQDIIIGLCYYAIEELGLQHIVIDSLVKVNLRVDERNDLVGFIDTLQRIAKHNDVHIHLVHHLRKPNDSRRSRASRHDIKYGTEIPDLADNVIIVERNVQKEIEMDDGITDRAGEPDAFLLVDKQRNYSCTGRYGFWFDPYSMQYLGQKSQEPRKYVK